MIFDDDPVIGAMVLELVRGCGLSAEYFQSAAGAVQIVKDTRPRLVILDIMMPGIDGLSACHAIRANVSTRHVKVLMLSAKSSIVDRQAAARYGADHYLTKPFSVEEFTGIVRRLTGIPAKNFLPGELQLPSPPLILNLLHCGAVLQAGNLWVFLDMGYGTGAWLDAQEYLPDEAWILFTRYDGAATAEVEAGADLLAEGCRVKIGGPDSPDSPLQRLAPRMCRKAPGAALPMLYPQKEDEVQLAPGISLTCRYARHPGASMAYRVETRDKSVVYCPVNEIDPDPKVWRSHEADKFRKFFKGANVLVHGFRRSQEDPKADDGHGTGAWEPIIDMAAEAGVRELILLPQPGVLPPPDLSDRIARNPLSSGFGMHCSAFRLGQRLLL